MAEKGADAAAAGRGLLSEALGEEGEGVDRGAPAAAAGGAGGDGKAKEDGAPSGTADDSEEYAGRIPTAAVVAPGTRIAAGDGPATPQELAAFKASLSIPYEAPKIAWEGCHKAPRYYEWTATFPFLRHMLPYVDVIRDELLAVSRWTDWPETNLYKRHLGAEWRVLPFVHTFPAYEEDKREWLESAAAMCPKTTAILQALPGIRTALFSRMGPGTLLAAHQGWADLSNYVLRVHLPLVVPEGGKCGMVVEGEERLHEQGEFLIFDDSKLHMAFNRHPSETRLILIFDLLRPNDLPLGEAEGGTTAELESFKDYFK